MRLDEEHAKSPVDVAAMPEAAETVAPEVNPQIVDLQDSVEALETAEAISAVLRRIGKIGLYGAGAAFAVTLPAMAGAAAVRDMPAVHSSIVGLETTSTVQVGQPYSRLDAGLIGSISTPEHRNFLGFNFGMDVSVQGDNVNLSESTTRNVLGEVLSNPQPEIDRIVGETTAEARDRFVLAGGKMLAFEAAAGALVFGSRRLFGPRGELLSNNGQRRFYNWAAKPLLAGISAVYVIGPAATNGAAPILSPDRTHIQADPALQGTGLQGFQLNGPIENAAPTLANGFEPSQKESDKTSADVIKLLRHRPNLMAQLHRPGVITAEQGDDIQDRSSMAQQVGALGEALGVKHIWLTGDISTISQIGFGSYLMDIINHYSGGISTWMMDGDHDTKLTNYYASLDNFNVADNKTHDVDGMPVLFLNSIYISTLGADGIPTVRRDPNVSATQAVDNAANEICETNPVIVALHDYKEAKQIVAQLATKDNKNCNIDLPTFITGRSFEQLGAISITVPGKGTAVIFVSGSTGAHNSTSPQFGNIPIDAPVNVYAINKTTHEVDVVTFTYHPNGKVSVPDGMTMISPPQTGVSNLSSGKRAGQDAQSNAGGKLKNRAPVISRSQSRHRGTTRQSRIR